MFLAIREKRKKKLKKGLLGLRYDLLYVVIAIANQVYSRRGEGGGVGA